MPRKEFEAFTRLDASDVNSFLMDQTVMSFAGTAARGSAIPSPVEGMTTYLEDANFYESYTGSAWTPLVGSGNWIPYTPTLTNMTLGNGTINAAYMRTGKTVHVAFRFLLGSTSSIGASGGKSVSLPLTVKDTNYAIFDVMGVGTANYPGITPILPVFYIGNTVLLLAQRVNTTYIDTPDISNTIPFTWVAGNTLSFHLTYEAE
jgi:hypothetical protein